MKIINETADEITIVHPSVARLALGSALTVLGGALFIAVALGMPGSLPGEAGAFACFCAGIYLLFKNAGDVIEISRRGAITHRVRGFTRTWETRYEAGTAAKVEIAPGRRACTSYIAFKNGGRLLIDRAHGHAMHALSDEERMGEERTIAARVARFMGVPLEEALRAV